jgi:hypothetical protein
MRWMHDSARSLAESGSSDLSQGIAASILHMSAMGDTAEMWGGGNVPCHAAASERGPAVWCGCMFRCLRLHWCGGECRICHSALGDA